MGRCLNCGAETIFPPMCDACMSAPHRDGCRCQECFDRLRKELAAEREAVERYRNSINHIRQFFDTLSPQEVVNVCHAATHPGTKPPPYSGYLKPHQSMCEKDSELTTLKSKHKCLVAEVDAWRDWDDKISSVDAENDNSDDGVNALQVLHFARAATDAAKAREAP